MGNNAFGISRASLAAAALAMMGLAAGRVSSAAEPSSLGIDKASVADKAALAAVEQIEQKLSAIERYSCKIEMVSNVKGGKLAYTQETYFQRPNLYFCHETQDDHVIPGMKGEVTYKVADGNTLWRHQQAAPGSGQAFAQRLSKLPQAKRLEMAQEHEKPKLYRYDLNRMNQAGCATDVLDLGYAQLLAPFRQMDAASLRVLAEDNETWTFSAPPSKPIPEIASIRPVVGKGDGVLRVIRFVDQGENASSVMTVSNVQINPTFAANLFTFVPPAGLTATDDTASLLESLRRQGAF